MLVLPWSKILMNFKTVAIIIPKYKLVNSRSASFYINNFL